MTTDESQFPPDRSHVETESRRATPRALHLMLVSDLVEASIADAHEAVRAFEMVHSELAALIEAAEPGFVGGGRLVYVGAGTSGRLGVLDASEIPPTFQLPPERVVGIIAGGDRSLRVSSESREDERDGAVDELRALGLTARDTLIGIAAGGTTPYVLGGLAWAKELSSAPVTALLCCSPPSDMRGIDHVVCARTGPELVSGSTRLKAGTATKLMLNTISTVLMIRSGRVYGDLMVDVRASNSKLQDRAARIVSQMTGLNRAEAFGLLDCAGGEVKVAAVMELAGVSAEEARQRLQAHGGRLHLALGRDSDQSTD